MELAKIIILVLTFFIVWMFPSSTDSRKFIPLSREVTIKSNKNFPPYIAFTALVDKGSKIQDTIRNSERVYELKTIDSEDSIMETPIDPRPNLSRLVLSPITIVKSKENLNVQIANKVSDDVEIIGSQVENTNTVNTSFQFASTHVQKNPLLEDIKTKENSDDPNLVRGLLQINDGLALTNEHYIEIRRFEEGIFQEKGSVNLLQGTYQLSLIKPKGYILARLRSKNGSVLGEGIARVSDTQWSIKGTHRGPKINIYKKTDLRGKLISAYNFENKVPLNAKGTTKSVGSTVFKDVEKDGIVNIENIAKDSSTNLVSHVTNHVDSQQVVISKTDFTQVMFPEKMIEGFKLMVSEIRQQNLNDPHLTVIWGQVLLDKKPISGIKVMIENFENIEPVYFDSFMIPSRKSRVTTENGYFAFIGAPEQFHQITAYRNDAYFGHVNAKVDSDIVTFVQIESSIKSEEVDVKVFDAFSGKEQSSELVFQSLPEKVEVQNGQKTIYLPSVSRLSFLYSEPNLNYLSAFYSYVDKTDYVYVPLISKAWLSYVFKQKNINYAQGTSVIIGFVNDEDFEVDIPILRDLQYQNNHAQILYFDYNGVITDSKTGTQGGGFIAVNVEPNIYEILVKGLKTEKLHSRITPVNSENTYVFNFKSDL